MRLLRAREGMMFEEMFEDVCGDTLAERSTRHDFEDVSSDMKIRSPSPRQDVIFENVYGDTLAERSPRHYF